VGIAEGRDGASETSRPGGGGPRGRAGANLACQEVAYSSRTKASPGNRVCALRDGGVGGNEGDVRREMSASRRREVVVEVMEEEEEN
jgi:hypothetical protein